MAGKMPPVNVVGGSVPAATPLVPPASELDMDAFAADVFAADLMADGVVAPNLSIFQDRKDAFAVKWSAFKRRTVVEAKDLADEFNPIYSAMPHGEKKTWLGEIGMGRQMAARLVRVANEIQMCAIHTFEGDTWTDLVKSLPPKQVNKAAPQPPPPAAQDSDQAAPAAETPEDPSWAKRAMIERLRQPEVSAAELDELVRDEQATFDAEAKEKRDERLAMRLEGSDLDAVDALSSGIDRLEKQLAETRAQVVNANKEIAHLDKTLKTIMEDLLQGKLHADILAVHFGVAPKTGAAV